MKIKDFKICNEEGTEIPADPDGNNVAFLCCCGHPVLIARIGMSSSRGYYEEKPTECKGKGCGAKYFLDTRQDPTTGEKLPWCCPKKDIGGKKEVVHRDSSTSCCCANKFFEGKRQDEKIFYIHRLA